MIAQVPAATIVTVVPEIVHTLVVFVAKLTESPEDAVAVTVNAAAPKVGDLIYLFPRHVCPTVNNFDQALFVKDGRVIGVEDVTARGHEAPLDRNLVVKQPSSGQLTQLSVP